jgi:hypothetical protein
VVAIVPAPGTRVRRRATVRLVLGPGHRARTVIVRAVPLRPVRYGACRFSWGAQLVARDGQAALALFGSQQGGMLYRCAARSGNLVTVAVAALAWTRPAP